MKLGVNSVLFGGHDLQSAVEQIQFCGYEGMELASIVGMAEHLSDTASDQALQDIRKMVEQAGLELYCVEAATNILEAENRERTKRVFERAAKLGIPMVTTGSAGESDNEEKMEASLKAIEELSQAAHDVGIQFALKIHYGQSIYNTETALRLMKEIQHPALGLNFDATHVGRVGDDPVQAIGALKDYIIHSHIRDTKIEQLQIAAPEFQTAGRGTVPLDAVVNKMVDIHYQGATVLEIIGANDYSLEQVTAIAAESRGYLKRLFEEAKAEAVI
ncbi:sugar phosphate isomerase/epimerase [Gracilibacillus caseinilyticus]|uniref:Sugar phosphate isomerase/epimerase n=1 Tax=Gracilibacillus caseinilyticus TaxID=2932256 RepID=A0ABY4F125_9BACI|nr:sugar phosphate isomerase/epimerase [Gracilibacillus caseinilyticus]UOQ50376.1 sugar phosphate isomerase/epimerase [Gracilibacillus caseinilyticus]